MDASRPVSELKRKKYAPPPLPFLSALTRIRTGCVFTECNNKRQMGRPTNKNIKKSK